LSAFFVDTSALAKRYIAEIGSSWLRGIVLPIAGNVVIIADLTLVEMFSLLARRGREGTLHPGSVVLLGNAVVLHAKREYLTMALDNPVLTQARVLVNNHPLRALNAIQLGCAIRARAAVGEPVTFVSGDKSLLTAAATEGFAIDDPNAHP